MTHTTVTVRNYLTYLTTGPADGPIVSASVTDTMFWLGELGVGSNPYPVGHPLDYHVSLTLTYIAVKIIGKQGVT